MLSLWIQSVKNPGAAMTSSLYQQNLQSTWKNLAQSYFVGTNSDATSVTLNKYRYEKKERTQPVVTLNIPGIHSTNAIFYCNKGNTGSNAGSANLQFHSMHVEMSTVSQYERNNSYCNKKGKTEILVGQTNSLTLVTTTWFLPARSTWWYHTV